MAGYFDLPRGPGELGDAPPIPPLSDSWLAFGLSEYEYIPSDPREGMFLPMEDAGWGPLMRDNPGLYDQTTVVCGADAGGLSADEPADAGALWNSISH
jgi:hypothetical protein